MRGGFCLHSNDLSWGLNLTKIPDSRSKPAVPAWSAMASHGLHGQVGMGNTNNGTYDVLRVGCGSMQQFAVLAALRTLMMPRVACAG